MRSVIKTTVIYFTGIAQRLKTSGLDYSDGKIQTAPKFALLYDSLQRDKGRGYTLCRRTILQCQNEIIFVFGSRMYHMSKDSKHLGGRQ